MNRYLCTMKDKYNSKEHSFPMTGLGVLFVRQSAETQYPELKMVKISFLGKVEYPKNNDFEENGEFERISKDSI